jgi:hypothetical protein
VVAYRGRRFTPPTIAIVYAEIPRYSKLAAEQDDARAQFSSATYLTRDDTGQSDFIRPTQYQTRAADQKLRSVVARPVIKSSIRITSVNSNCHFGMKAAGRLDASVNGEPSRSFEVGAAATMQSEYPQEH